MACKTNNRFEVHSNIKHYLEQDFASKKAVHDANPKNDRYRWSEYYEVVAAFCGVAPSTIVQMKTKDSLPSLVVALRLAEWLKVPLSDLLQAVEKNDPIEVPLCVVEGCRNVATTRGMCIKHVTKFYNNKEHKEEVQ